MPRFLAVIFLCLATLGAVAGVWFYAGKPVAMPPSPMAANEKLGCVSYAPFRRGQTPFNESYSVPESQIREDFKHLKEVTSCVRTYAVNQGLEHVPQIAREMGMQVILGLWLGRDVEANAVQIRRGVQLARDYKDVIRLVVVGNEVLLRGELSAEDLATIMQNVKSRISVPVTYADVWEFWLKHPDLKDVADVITIHILPYWEDKPIPAEIAGAHVANIHNEVALKLGDKPILIGETGFPSQGRMRWGARPSPAGQALVFHDLVRLSKQYNFDVNYIEAFDQPWKRSLEGIAGGYWGLFDADSREAKFHWGQPVSNYPNWIFDALLGGALVVGVFAAAALAARGRSGISLWRWTGVALIAGVAGSALGFALDMAYMSTRTTPEGIRAALYLLCAVVTPLLGAAALVRSESPAPFAAILKAEKAQSNLAWWTGAFAVLTTLLALQAVLGLAFDARYRDFPTMSLIAAIAALLIARWAAHKDHGKAPAPHHRLSEKVAASILVLGGIVILVLESPLNAPLSDLPDVMVQLPNFFANWEALIFVLALFSLAGTLYAARGVREPAAED